MDFNHHKKEEAFNDSSICNMTRILSEIDLEEFFKHSIVAAADADVDHRSHPSAGGIFPATDGVVFGNDDRKSYYADGGSPNLTVPCRHRDNINRFSNSGVWSQNLTSKNSCVTMTMDCQSSICVGSPTSATKPIGNKLIGATSDDEQSDDDDTEIEAGQCEQSIDQIDVKRMKRMVSNRESARRSRKRKQAYLTDLEQQVEQLRGEYSTLFKQLTNASQQFKDASTNNCVLKSKVEELRAKVKLAEDTITRGSLTSSLSHLLHNRLTTPQPFDGQTMGRMGNVSPTITVRGDDHNPHTGLPITQHPMVGLGTNHDIFNKNGVVSGNAGSCGAEIWQ